MNLKKNKIISDVFLINKDERVKQGHHFGLILKIDLLIYDSANVMEHSS